MPLSRKIFLFFSKNLLVSLISSAKKLSRLIKSLRFYRCLNTQQGAKKVVSDSPGLVDFAIGLVNSVLNLPDGQVKIFRIIKIKKVPQDKCFKFLINSCRPKVTPTK